MMTLKEAVAAMSGGRQQDPLMVLRSYIAGECPTTLKALRMVDVEYASVKRHKGYNLVKRDNKKLGFVYYIRYWHEGRMLPSKWCTHTNILPQAQEFAERNRASLIAGYLSRCEGGEVRFFRSFYDPRSTEYLSECKRNGELSAGRQKRYHSVMNNKFVPFLTEKRITAFEKITVTVLDDFQDYLLAGGMKAQSVNDDMIAVHKAFRYLLRKGRIKENPCRLLPPVPERQEQKKTHGCYELEKLKGVFNRQWKDKTSYLLNLMIYTTDMRNSEIKRFSKNDVVTIGDCHFIDLKDSKSENGIRWVPLHKTVYRKVTAYAKGLDSMTPIFGALSDYRFQKAYRDMGRLLGFSEAFLKEHNITYYSGRHFWKTMMSAGGLGEDVEEVFMGHKVSGNVAKLYNHRDAQGKWRLVKKARKVFAILDAMLFCQKPAGVSVTK
ncbi:MAG: phage integrase SAM-like domain-containing protein [Treponema sp.]|jgi:integrase|nr:phage integrase SAM-like domain-containing protein [Treponema sp.]